MGPSAFFVGLMEDVVRGVSIDLSPVCLGPPQQSDPELGGGDTKSDVMQGGWNPPAEYLSLLDGLPDVQNYPLPSPGGQDTQSGCLGKGGPMDLKQWGSGWRWYSERSGLPQGEAPTSHLLVPCLQRRAAPLPSDPRPQGDHSVVCKVRPAASSTPRLGWLCLRGPSFLFSEG